MEKYAVPRFWAQMQSFTTQDCKAIYKVTLLGMWLGRKTSEDVKKNPAWNIKDKRMLGPFHKRQNTWEQYQKAAIGLLSFCTDCIGSRKLENNENLELLFPILSQTLDLVNS